MRASIDVQVASSIVRAELTKQAYMLEGLNTDFIDAQGETPLAQQWTALHFGDYLAYYLAMLYETDPTPIEALEGFKKQLSGHQEIEKSGQWTIVVYYDNIRVK